MYYIVNDRNEFFKGYKHNNDWLDKPHIYRVNPWVNLVGETWKSMIKIHTEEMPQYMREEVPWRIIKAEHLSRIQAEHAITKKDFVSIIDKYNLDIWGV